MKITFLAVENCLSSGIAGLLDALTIANLWQQKITGHPEQLFTAEIVSVDGGPVVSGGCIQLVAGQSIADARALEYIIIPPLVPLPDLQTPEFKKAAEWIVRKHAAGVPVAALCTGTFLLAETGLLDGRLATTHWQYARTFNRRYPRVRLKPERIITEEEGLICTGAATSYYNFALALIEKYGSQELAGYCSKSLLIDPHRTSQAPYFFEYTQRNHKDADIEKAQHFMECRLGGIASIDEIASHIHLSPRHFKRRFKQATGCSPLFYLQTLRIELAKKKLESTLDSIDEISLEVGYQDAGTFRRLFKNRTSLSPRAYRDKFTRKSTSPAGNKF
jgi:transcriptional regulator GlxA family with amidase domain